MFRLRTYHNHLNYHLYSKHCIGYTGQCLVVLAVRQQNTYCSPASSLATQKGNLARPHSCSPQALLQPEGPAMHCHLQRGDWSFHLTKEKTKKNVAGTLSNRDATESNSNYGQSWPDLIRRWSTCCLWWRGGELRGDELRLCAIVVVPWPLVLWHAQC